MSHVKCNRELTENIPNWAYYPQLGISHPQLGIIYPIGDWGFLSQVEHSQRTNPQWDKISPIGDFKYPIVNIIPNWIFISVSPLIIDKDVCRTAPATRGL